MKRAQRHDRATTSSRRGSASIRRPTPRPRRTPAPAAPAFSLVELVIVMLVMAIVAAIAVPRYGQTIVRYRADLAARRIALAIGRTKMLARATSTSQQIEFRTASNAVAIANERSMTTAQTGLLISLADEPYRATLVSADFGGDGFLTFNGFGIPDSGGQAVIRVAGEQRTITLDASTGQTTITTP